MAKQVNFPKTLHINDQIIDLFDNHFSEIVTTNYFYGKRVYFSNFNDKLRPMAFQEIGNLGGLPVNYWEDEYDLIDAFIIYGDWLDLNNNEKLIIKNFYNQKQSLVDEKDEKDKDGNIIFHGKLSTKVHIIRYETFLSFYKERQRNNLKIQSNDKFYHTILKSMQNPPDQLKIF